MRHLLFLPLFLIAVHLSAAEDQYAYYSPRYRAEFQPETLRQKVDAVVKQAESTLPAWDVLIGMLKKNDPDRAKILELRKEIFLKLIAYVHANMENRDDPEAIFFARQGAEELELLVQYQQEEKERLPLLSRPETVLRLDAFGGKGDGVADDAPAFRAALTKVRELRRNSDAPIRLLIPAGRYRLSSIPPPDRTLKARDTLQPGMPQLEHGDLNWQSAFISLFNLDNLTLEGEGEVLLLPELADCDKTLAIIGCRNVTIKNVAIDYPDLPFTQGEVTAFDGKSVITLRMDNDFPAPDLPRFLKSKETLGLLVRDGNIALGTDLFFKRDTVKNADGTFRINLEDTQKNHASASRIRPGDKVLILARHSAAVNLILSSFCDMVNLRVYSAPGIGFHGWNNNALSFQNCKIVPLPGSKRMVSSSSDASQTSSNLIGPAFLNCEFSNSMDDLVNITTRRAEVCSVRNEGREILVNGIVRPGHRAVLVDPASGQVQAEAVCRFMALGIRWDDKLTGIENRFEPGFPKTVSREMLGQKNHPSHEEMYLYYTGRKTMPKSPDWLLDTRLSGTGTIVYGCRGKMCRGSFRLQGANIMMADNIAEDLQGMGAGISLLPGWGEVFPVHNVTIRDNLFRRVKVGVAIYATPMPPDGSDNYRPIRGIEIIGNRFEDCRDVAIHAGQVRWITIAGNAFKSETIDSDISLSNASDVLIEKNHFRMPQRGNEKNYRSDARTTCVTVR